MICTFDALERRLAIQLFWRKEKPLVEALKIFFLDFLLKLINGYPIYFVNGNQLN